MMKGKENKHMGRTKKRPDTIIKYACELDQAYADKIREYQDYFGAVNIGSARPSQGRVIEMALDCLEAHMAEIVEASRGGE